MIISILTNEENDWNAYEPNIFNPYKKKSFLFNIFLKLTSKILKF